MKTQRNNQPSIRPTIHYSHFGGLLLKSCLLATLLIAFSSSMSGQGQADPNIVPITEDPLQAASKLILSLQGQDEFKRSETIKPIRKTDRTVNTNQLVANSVRPLAGCSTNALPANDDGSTGAVALPFTINYFGAIYSQTYVNNNGNITFLGPLSTFTPFGLASTSTPIIAPFFGDVDTRGFGSGLVQFGNTMVNGRTAFCVNYLGVGYFNARVDLLNSFQLILIDRSDTGPQNFDIEFNYNQILWETGDASGGSGGQGGFSARAGYANGTAVPGTFFELPGSAVNGGLLDSNLATGLTNNSLNSSEIGRYVFGVREGVVQSVNLLTDPGFENFGVGWQKTHFGGRTITNRNAHTGLISEQFIFSNRWEREVYQDVSVTPGQNYLVSGWMKTNRLDGPGVSIEIIWLNASGLPDWNLPPGSVLGVSSLGTVSGTQDWTKRMGTFTAPNNAVVARFRLYGAVETDGEGAAWFDDLNIN